MTRYDDPPASDGHGGPHPLAGIPQQALDAAYHELRDIALSGDVIELVDGQYGSDLEAVAHSVILSYLNALDD